MAEFVLLALLVAVGAAAAIWTVLAWFQPSLALVVWPSLLRVPCRDPETRRLISAAAGLVVGVTVALVTFAAWAPPANPGPHAPGRLSVCVVNGALAAAWFAYATGRVAREAFRSTWRLGVVETPPVEHGGARAVTIPEGLVGPVPRARDDRAHRPDRLLRRTRTVFLTVFIALLLVSKAFKDADLSITLPYLTVLVASGIGAYGTSTALRSRWQSSSNAQLRALANARGWNFLSRDDERLARRYTRGPLLRTTPGSHDFVWARTVDARTGPWHWWATEQHAIRQSNERESASFEERTTWVVSLPAATLPAVEVYGRDTAKAYEWFGENHEFELESFNRTWFVRHREEYGEEAHALIHPRMIELIGRSMPDGGRFAVAGDAAFLSCPGPMSVASLENNAAFLVHAVDLVPRWLMGGSTSDPYLPEQPSLLGPEIL